MELKGSLDWIWILLLLPLQSLGESSLTIDPNRPLYVMEHSKLKLDCTRKGNDGHVKWTKDGVELSEDEFVIATFRTAAVDGGSMKLITKLALSKNNLRRRDSGRYACVSGSLSAAIRVEVLRVETGSRVITEPGGIITLKCDPVSHDVDVIWTKNMTSLASLPELSGRIILETGNTTLRIRNASLADSGQYECHIKPRDGVIQGNLSTHVVLSGSPYFPDGHNVTETVTVSGERLELHCPAQGYPVPKVQWMSEGVRLNSSGGIQLLSYRGVSCAVLRIDDYIPEFGETFVCEAVNKQGRTSRNFQVVFVNSAQTLHSTSAILLLTLLVSLSIISSRIR